MTELLYNPDCWDWPIERRESHLRIVAPLYWVGSNKFKENKMRTKEEILAALERIEKDERLRYPSANVNVNAPLALIQTDLEARQMVLRWILDDDAPPLLSGSPGE